MGLTPKRKHNEKVAERLVEFKNAIEEDLRWNYLNQSLKY
jgi:hypothetical protein